MKIEIKKVADLSDNIDRDIKIFPKKVIIIDKQRKKKQCFNECKWIRKKL